MTNSTATLEATSLLGDCTTGLSPRVVCRCLQITDVEIREAVATCGVQDLKDLGRCTGAGQGCTACHRLLRRYLED
jgi:bacterioferritin-associated ferredoxin